MSHHPEQQLHSRGGDRTHADFEVRSWPPQDAQPAETPPHEPSPVERFTAMLLSIHGDETARRDLVAEIRAAGWTLERVVTSLFVPAARLLGDYWLSDQASFIDVTIAIHRLSVQFFELERAQPLPPSSHGGQFLLVPAPDDQHGFGILVLGFFLRRAGWSVTAHSSGDPQAVVDCVRGQRFDVVGFSIGHDRALAEIGDLIARVREVSRNQRVLIGVGGPALLDKPELCEHTGADFSACDAEDLIEKLDELHRPDLCEQC